MPKVFEWRGFRFFFYSNEGDPREPVHIHVMKDGNVIKVWLDPSVAIESSHGFNSREQRQIVEKVELEADVIRAAWKEHFGES